MEDKIRLYNEHDIIQWRHVMPRQKMLLNKEEENFGDHLALLRKQAGYSQRDLAKETGISQRMIAYYEKHPCYPPAHVLFALAKAFGVSSAELLNLKKDKTGDKVKDMRIRRRLSRIDQLDEKEKRKVIQLLDTFIEKDQLKKKTGT